LFVCPTTRRHFQPSPSCWTPTFGTVADLKRNFPLLLNAMGEEELFYDKETVKKVKPEQVYVHQLF
jgi:hypothetical protein